MTAHIQPSSSLAEVLAAILADESVSSGRKKAVKTHFGTYARAQGKSLDSLPADPAAHRAFIKRFHASKIGVSAGHWRNVVSSLNFALHHLGLTTLPGRSTKPLATQWQSLYVRLPDPGFRAGLSRLMRYCSSKAIMPTDINDAILSEFLRVLTEESLAKEPARQHRRTILTWNRAVAEIDGWQGSPLTVPNNKVTRTLLWDAFPVSLRDEIESFLAIGADPDPFEEHGPRRALAVNTINGHRYKLQCYCSALVVTGSRPEDLGTLEGLVELETVKRGLRHLLDHYKTAKTVYQFAQLLRAIARDHLHLADERITELSRLCKRIRREKPGMTDHNRELLRQLDDPRNVRNLLDLPARLVRKAKRLDRGRRDDVLLIQLALAVEILTVAPLRLGNLARLRLDRHIQRSRSNRGGVVHLVIDAEEVKNRTALEYELPHETVELLKLYLDDYRPRLTSPESPWLFPGRDGNHKVPAVLGRQISDIIFKEIGLKIHPHLFRHAMAKLFLDENPGQYEVVRRVLGHSSMNTTTTFYAGGEGVSAAKHFDKTILKLRRQSGTSLEGGL